MKKIENKSPDSALYLEKMTMEGHGKKPHKEAPLRLIFTGVGELRGKKGA